MLLHFLYFLFFYSFYSFYSSILVYLSDLKPLHAQWIVDFYNHFKTQREAIIKGFDESVKQFKTETMGTASSKIPLKLN